MYATVTAWSDKVCCVRQAVGAFEALLQEVSIYREADALLQDPQLVEGDATIAQGLSGLVFQNILARGIHSTSMKVRQPRSPACGLHPALHLRHSELTAPRRAPAPCCTSSLGASRTPQRSWRIFLHSPAEETFRIFCRAQGL